MKNKNNFTEKILFTLSGVTLICVVMLILYSCSNEDSSIKANTTEADKTSALVNSTEFNSFTENAKNIGTEIHANYLKLSKSDQVLFTSKLEQVKNAKDIGEAQSLIQSAGSLVKIDILTKIDSLNKQSSQLKAKGFFDDVNKRTLVSAISRSTLTKSNSVRFKVTAENENCKPNCLASLTVSLVLCGVTGPGYELCAAAAGVQYILCINAC